MTTDRRQKMLDVTLEGGSVLKLPLCRCCHRPEISAEDCERLWHRKVRVGRCRCTPSQKAAAAGTSDGH